MDKTAEEPGKKIRFWSSYGLLFLRNLNRLIYLLFLWIERLQAIIARSVGGPGIQIVIFLV